MNIVKKITTVILKKILQQNFVQIKWIIFERSISDIRNLFLAIEFAIIYTEEFSQNFKDDSQQWKNPLKICCLPVKVFK